MKVFLLFLIVQSRKIDPDANGNFVVHKKLDTDTFNFLMLGDWGGYPPPVGLVSFRNQIPKLCLREINDH